MMASLWISLPYLLITETLLIIVLLVSVCLYIRQKGCELESSKFQRKTKLITANYPDKFARYFVLFGYFVMFLVIFPVIIWFTLKKISENERLVVFRLGHLHKS
ncbi:hypothetical protein Btru_069475 [Bulinus truncatus]|nr:hypothetical protein Btru_069475 [Bulinus truncatus]